MICGMTDELDMFPVLLVMELTATCDFSGSSSLVMIMLRLLTDTPTVFRLLSTGKSTSTGQTSTPCICVSVGTAGHGW